MKVLFVKLSSLGDVVHSMPALTDAMRAHPGLRIDWVVEELFREIPRWHPAVRRAIPSGIRRWRYRAIDAICSGEVGRFVASLRADRYDYIIDAQGLIKSALVATTAHGRRLGLGFDSAREPLAARFYHRRFSVAPRQHAIQRIRQLMAAALDYPLPTSAPEYGVHFSPIAQVDENYIVFLHGTAWQTKTWPEHYWRQLVVLADRAGYAVHLPWGTSEEKVRAHRLAELSTRARVLPRMTLTELATELAGAAGVVGVDTGLSHVAAALNVPSVTLYGATQPALTGTVGIKQRHLVASFPCSPCMKRSCRFRGSARVYPACYGGLAPARVWSRLLDVVGLPA